MAVRRQRGRLSTCSAAAEQRGSNAALQRRLWVLPTHQRVMVLLLRSRIQYKLTPLHMNCSYLYVVCQRRALHTDLSNPQASNHACQG